MPYGYLGQNTPNQTVSNSGVFSISDVADLEKQGKFGGSLELIEEQTVSSVSAVDFTNLKGEKFDVHLLEFIDISSSTDNEQIQVRFSNDSGSTYETTNYQYAFQQGNASGSFNEVKSTSDNAIDVSNPIGNATNEKGNAYCYLYNLNNSSKYSFVTQQSNLQNNSNVFTFTFGGGVYVIAETINAIRVLLDNNSNISGTIKLYGVKQL
jgi:hypothetical protein